MLDVLESLDIWHHGWSRDIQHGCGRMTECIVPSGEMNFDNAIDAVFCNHDLLREILQYVQGDCFDKDAVSLCCQAWKSALDTVVKKISCNYINSLPILAARFVKVEVIDLSQVFGSVTDFYLECIASHFSLRLVALKCEDDNSFLTSSVTDRGLIAISSCTRLRNLALSGLERCTSVGYGNLFRGCCDLEQLRLNRLISRNTDQEQDIGYNIVQALFANCHNLSSLDLSCRIFDDRCLPKIFGCSHLKFLTLEGSFTLEHPCLHTMIFQCSMLQDLTIAVGHATILPSRQPKFFEDLFFCCQNLHSLQGGTTFSHEAFQLVHLTSLTHLSISNPDHITQPNFTEVLKANTRLTSVEISSACHTCVEGEVNSLFSAAAMNCPRLTRLVDTSGSLSDYSLQSLMFTTTLRHLNLCSSTITSHGLGVVASACRSLLEIYLDFCLRVEDFGLQCLTAGCMRLQTIHIQGCSKLTNLGLVSLATCSCLEDLDVSYSQLDDATLLAILRETPRMRILGLAACNQLVDASAVAACPTLISVNLEGVQAVSDGSIRAIAASCVRLEMLRIGYTRITLVALEYLAHYAQRLKLLTVSGQNLSPDALLNVTDACVWLKDLIVKESPMRVPRTRPGCRLGRFSP